MTSDALYPLSFDTSAPSAGTAEYLRDPSIRLLVSFFRDKGLEALKDEDRREQWYQDWIDYQAEHRLYASVLSPGRYSRQGYRFNLLKLTRFLEVFAYCSPAHAYSLHVSFLGLFPILMSSNESLKQEAIARLEAGGLFAFGVSEKAHGSDLFANEFTLRPVGPAGEHPRAVAGWVADGAKYYIGNANAACILSILAKEGVEGVTSKRSPFTFFVLRPQEAAQGYCDVRKIHTLGIRSAFVGEFKVQGHPVPGGDILSRGRDAWNAVLGTVDFGKFFLGFGAVGICEHAFVEAFDHLRQRVLYGKPVTAMSHIQAGVTFAFARLMVMKLYAYRALDYLQASSHDDRRYLLFSAVQKAKVSTEGVKVMGLLSECVGARGFEVQTYFESALRETQLIPGLEGSTHINFALTAQFLAPYFAEETDSKRPALPPIESVALRLADLDENPSWMEARDRNVKTIRFPDYLSAYAPLRSVPNVRLFVKQVEAFRRFVAEAEGVSAFTPSVDASLPIALGKCLSVIAYAQLAAEGCLVAKIANSTVSVAFHALIEDLSSEALKLSAMFSAASSQRALLKRVVRIPRTSAADLNCVSEWISANYG